MDLICFNVRRSTEISLVQAGHEQENSRLVLSFDQAIHHHHAVPILAH